MRSIAQKFAKVFGAVYVLVGVLGFVSAAGGTASQTPNLLLGIFGVTLAHNVAHLAIGAAFLVGSYSPRSARITCVTIGAAYVVLGTVGLLEYRPVDDLLNINQADNILHFATGLLAIMFGLVEAPVAQARQKHKRESRPAMKARKAAAAPAQVEQSVQAPVVEQTVAPVMVQAEAPAPAPVQKEKAPRKTRAPRESRKERKARESQAAQVLGAQVSPSASVADQASVPQAAAAAGPASPDRIKWESRQQRAAQEAPTKSIKAPRESRKARKARKAQAAQAPGAAGISPPAPMAEEAVLPQATPAGYPASPARIKWESRSARTARQADAVPKVESVQSWIADDAPAPTVELPAVPVAQPTPVAAEISAPRQAGRRSSEPTQEIDHVSRPMTPRELSRQAQKAAKAARKARKAAPGAQAAPVVPTPTSVAGRDEIAQAIASIQPPVSAADRKRSKRESRFARKGRKSVPAEAEGIGPDMERLDNPVLVGGPADPDKTQELHLGN